MMSMNIKPEGENNQTAINEGIFQEKKGECEVIEPPSLTFTNEEVSSLIKKMLTLGYFHKEGGVASPEKEGGDEVNVNVDMNVKENIAAEKELHGHSEITLDSIKQYQAAYAEKRHKYQDQEDEYFIFFRDIFKFLLNWYIIFLCIFFSRG